MIKMIRQISMNLHSSKGYISKFQIVFKHYSVTGLCVGLTSTENVGGGGVVPPPKLLGV